MEQLKTHHPEEPAPAPYEPTNLSGTSPFTLRDVAAILRRRAALALLTFAVTVGAALFVTSRMTKTYEATTKLLLDNAPSTSMPGSMLDIVMNNNASSSGEVQIAKIKSRAFLSEVIRKSKLGPEASPDDLQNRLSVSLTGGDKIMVITATMKNDPVMTARVANVTAEVYKEYVKNEAERNVERSSQRLTRAAAKAEEKKNEANRELQAFMAKRGVSDPTSFYINQSKRTVEIQNTLRDAERDLPSIRNNIDLFARQVRTISPTITTATSLSRNAQIEYFQDQIVLFRNERRLTLQNFGDQSPEIFEIDGKIASAQVALKSLKSNPFRPGGVGFSRNPDWATAYSNFLGAKKDFEQSEVRIGAFRKQLAELKAEQSQLAPERVQYEELKLRVDVTSEAYAKANIALIQMPINQITSEQSIDTLEKARVPTAPISPKPLLNTIMAVVAGLVLGFAVALVAEYFSPASKPGGSGLLEPSLPQLPARPVFAGNLPSIAGVPLLARVSLSGGRALPSHIGSGLPMTGADAATEDAFREIGYLLSHPADAGATRVPVVLMAGTRTDETTASVAAYLTATLVRDGVRVTLVDGDRIEPRLHQVFGKADAPGVTDILAGRITVGEALHVGAGGTLRFLAAGAKSDPTPLTEDALRDLYNELGRATDTDLVLISGPSVWSARMVSPMERAADGVVLVASDAQVAPEESVARARRILTNGYQPRLLGVIVGEETDKEPSALAAKPDTN
ncbi:MAG: hypothetical protein H7145_09435 [Akkermansiaceae bacterium]|nr:hypothetical protein [Armatimonadota bacterium]